MTSTFPAPIELPPAPVEDVYNTTTATPLPYVSVGWSDEANEPGSGSVTLQLDDEDMISPGDLITGIIDGAGAFSFIAERRIRRSFDPIRANRTVKWSGKGQLYEWAKWPVTPPNGLGVSPEAREVRYDWTTCSIALWDTPDERSVVIDRTALPPFGLAGMPLGMPNPLAYWLAPRAGVSGDPDPTGVFYLGCDFTLEEDTYLIFYWVADDIAAVALDGVVVDAFQDRDAMAAYQTHYRQFLKIPAGDHTWRVKVENVDRPHPQNCGLFAMAVAARTVSGVDITEDWLHTTSIADGWKSLDYGEDEPGFTWGQILIAEHAKAAADGSPLGDWTLNFGPTGDTDSNPWPRVQQRFRAGMSLLDVIRQGVDAGQLEVHARAGGRVLDAWVPGGRGSVRASLSQSVCREITHDVDHSGIVDRLLTLDDQGRFRWFGDDEGPAAFVELGGIDSDAALEAVAGAKLDIMDEPSTSVSLVHLPATVTLGPYGDDGYEVGDIVPVISESGVGYDNLRVVRIDLRMNQRSGRLEWVPTFASTRRQLQDRLEIAARRQTPGVKGESIAPVTPLQPPAGVVELWGQKWTWSGKASELAEGTDPVNGPIDEIRRPLRIQFLSVIATEDGDGATSTRVRILSDGTVLPLGLGDVSITSTEVFAQEDLIYLAQPGELVQAQLEDRGDHVTGTVTMSGGFLPQ